MRADMPVAQLIPKRSLERMIMVMKNEDADGGGYLSDENDPAHLLRYILAWKVPKKTFSNDDETPAPSHVSASYTHLEIKAKAKMNMKITSNHHQSVS